MSLRKKEYIDRLVDKKIDEYLSVFGAVSIEGPKWCGKTWASLNHANSAVYLDEEEAQEKAKLSLELILNNDKPELIDEWNLIPQIWDAVRRKCDETTEKGNYILTCSTKLKDDIQKDNIHHSGAGRIGKIQMLPGPDHSGVQDKGLFPGHGSKVPVHGFPSGLAFLQKVHPPHSCKPCRRHRRDR